MISRWKLALFLLVPAVLAFKSQINYGCDHDAGNCKFEFIIPEQVARYINMNDLINMVHTLNGNLVILNNTVWSAQNNSDPSTFTTIFDGKESTTNTTLTKVEDYVIGTNGTSPIEDTFNATYDTIQTGRDQFMALAQATTCFMNSLTKETPSASCWNSAVTAPSS
ncbi:hypothetical protein WR25_15882 [Diploscapter pachys]|uniref:Uncharacterized protein n=1 Tax=Diploscapter pachys TaxID=2018661 RepID=A0A2A2LHN6_9BILA|nr:hypothetical protein WR25_15882 [Diploscapter pachys]